MPVKFTPTVYLLHFNKPYYHAQHYIGYSDQLDKRITDHLCGMGARLIEVITIAGIEWRCVRTWPGDRHLERKLKNWHNAALLCPACSGKAAYGRGNFETKQPTKRNNRKERRGR
jgi:predicted GIY-YIG superfamily endonuclease